MTELRPLDNTTPQTLSEPTPGLAEEVAAAWRSLPFKAPLLTLGTAWIALFVFLGNSTFGYIDSPSLFGWLAYAYSLSQDDELGKYVPFIVAVLCWRNKDELLACPKAPWAGGIALVGFALLLHLLGFLVQQTRLSVVGFYVGIYGLIGTIWGWRMLKAIFFPFFLFAFCVPLGTLAETITFPLRVVATNITTWTSQHLLGVTVIQSGNKILDAQGAFQYEVAAACGGLRSLTATLALASIYAFITLERPWRRALMILSALPLAVAGNVLRLTMIILAAEAFGQKAGMWVHDNSILSLLPYVPAFLGLGALGALLRERSPASTTPPSSSSPPPEPAPLTL
ncbi:MAG: exosortase/archaeosortase family protein [Verrucomicrobiales bacterium]|nr:exosortase/archaeosortase family protein [Verrucomicrobiales bacterium]